MSAPLTYVEGTVEKSDRVEFARIIQSDSDYSLDSDYPVRELYATPAHGTFTIKLLPAKYQVRVNGEIRWLINVPPTPGTYALEDITTRTFDREGDANVKLAGSRMKGRLILSETPVSGVSEPLQATTVEFVEQKVDEAILRERAEYVQASPVDHVIIPHNLGRKPSSIRLTDLNTGMDILFTAQDVDVNNTEFHFGANFAFTARFA